MNTFVPSYAAPEESSPSDVKLALFQLSRHTCKYLQRLGQDQPRGRGTYRILPVYLIVAGRGDTLQNAILPRGVIFEAGRAVLL